MASSSSAASFKLKLHGSEKDYALMVEERDFVTTKFFDDWALNELGLDGPVYGMLAHGGLADFGTRTAKSYPLMTKEFLATLKVHRDDAGTVRTITFRFRNNTLSFDREDMASCFGVSSQPSAGWTDEYVGNQPVLWWHTVTGVAHTSTSAHSRLLPHPALQLCMRVLSNTFLCKGEATKVPLVDLKYL